MSDLLSKVKEINPDIDDFLKLNLSPLGFMNIKKNLI
jgi:hypothetical protein